MMRMMMFVAMCVAAAGLSAALLPRTEGEKKLPPPQLAERIADPGTYDLSVTPTGDSVDIEYRTTAFKSLNDRNNALASGAK